MYSLSGSRFQSEQGGSKHGRRTSGISYEDYYAREISRFVCNIYLFAIINKNFNKSFTPVRAVAQWVRRRSSKIEIKSVVTGYCTLEVPARVETLTNLFSAMIIISVLLGLMDFSDIVILCSRPNSCCQQKLKVFVSLYYATFLISLSSFPVVFVEGPHLLLWRLHGLWSKWIHSKTIKETACSHMTSLEAQMFDWYFSSDKKSCSHNVAKQTL